MCYTALGERGKRPALSHLQGEKTEEKRQKLFMALTATIEQSDCPRLKDSCCFPEQRVQNAAVCLPWGRGERSWFKMHIPDSCLSWLGVVTEIQVPVGYHSLLGIRAHSQQVGQGLSQREILGISHKIMFPDSKSCEISFSSPLHFSNRGLLEMI